MNCIKPLYLVATFLLFSIVCISQDLAGRWEGSYQFNRETKNYPISLRFNKANDSIYKVFSYTPMGNDTTVCQLVYELIGKDSIYLREVLLLHPQALTITSLQKMYLRIKKRKQVLQIEGTWETTDDNFGRISFTKMPEP